MYREYIYIYRERERERDTTHTHTRTRTHTHTHVVLPSYCYHVTGPLPRGGAAGQGAGRRGPRALPGGRVYYVISYEMYNSETGRLRWSGEYGGTVGKKTLILHYSYKSPFHLGFQLAMLSLAPYVDVMYLCPMVVLCLAFAFHSCN